MTDMTEAKQQGAGVSASLQGRVFRPTTAGELAEAVELAMDYRGDVTLELASGEMIEGYLFNRERGGENPWVEIFPVGVSSVRQIPYALIRAIAFTGKDAADGKSWEAWVSKKEAERKAEAKRIEEDARNRGLL
ncbi:MAG: hypothetical protein NNA18_04525 [Nitrospira sp.]|nr:hypothetical protein [Nitrospira sp.]